MKIITNENTRPFDVDGTLILPFEGDDTTKVLVEDPVFPCKFIKYQKHEPNIRLLREELQRGSICIVWSRGGWEWARNVIMALGIDHKNLLIMSKPMVYFDDVEVQDWLKDRVYLDPNKPYRK